MAWAVRGPISLVVPFQIYTPGSDTPRDGCLPDRADCRAAVELELTDATDVHRQKGTSIKYHFFLRYLSLLFNSNLSRG